MRKKKYFYNYDITTQEYIGVVYSYTNTTADDSEYGYVYVGNTINEYNRKSVWKSLKTKKYAGEKINKARKKFGIKAFDYKVLIELRNKSKEALKHDLDDWEKIYIGYYDSVNNGYNTSEFGNGSKGSKFTEEHKQKIADSHYKIPMKVIESSSKEITFFKSMSELSRKLKVSLSVLHYIVKSGIEKKWKNYQISVA